MLRTLNVDAVLHRKHVHRVHAILQTPPRNDVAYLSMLHCIKHRARLKLAIPSNQLNLDVFAKQPVQQWLHKLLLVHVQRRLHVAKRETLDVHQKQRLITQDEAFLASTKPSVRIT